MSKTLDFIFDFGSPNAYLAYKALPPLLERSGAHLHMLPCLLGGIFKSTGNQSPIYSFKDVKGKLDYEHLEIARFVKKHGVFKYKMNPHFPVNSLILMRGALAAELDGRLIEYVEAGFKTVWEDGLNMSDAQVYVQAMTEAGFDGKRLLEQTQNPEIKAKLMVNTQAAVDRGVFGAPTFFVGDEMFFGKDRLGQLEEALGA